MTPLSPSDGSSVKKEEGKAFIACIFHNYQSGFKYLKNHPDSRVQRPRFCLAVPTWLQTCGARWSSCSPSPPHQCGHLQQDTCQLWSRAERGSRAGSGPPDGWTAPHTAHRLAPGWTTQIRVSLKCLHFKYKHVANRLKGNI